MWKACLPGHRFAIFFPFETHAPFMTILFPESEFVLSMPGNFDQIAKWLEYSNQRRTTNCGWNDVVVFLDEVTLVCVLCWNSEIVKSFQIFKSQSSNAFHLGKVRFTFKTKRP